jgi:hypothetical protein
LSQRIRTDNPSPPSSPQCPNNAADNRVEIHCDSIYSLRGTASAGSPMTAKIEGQALKKELLPTDLRKPGPNSWFLTNASIVSSTPDHGGHGVKLHALKPTPRAQACAVFRVEPVPVMHELLFSCLLRGSRSGQTLRVGARSYSGSRENSMNMSTSKLVVINNQSWTPFECTYVVPGKAITLYLHIDNLTEQSAYIAQASLTLGEETTEQSYDSDYSSISSRPTATKVIQATYKACVRALKDGDEGIVTFPIPGPYRDQVPLTFDVDARPKSALLDYCIHKRDDELNWIAAVRVKPPPKGVIITWKSVVLIRGSTEASLPKTKQHAPPELSQWLKATKCVQSDSPEIVAKASQLAPGADDVETLVRLIVGFTSRNQGTGEKYNSLDAKTALERGGSCTSRANLAAALLRAQGVPARTVAHLPAWHRGPLFEHWLVEYWHPGVGWIWVEPTLNRFQPASNDLVILAVSSPDDEDLADEPIHLRYIAPGAAYLSGCELSPELDMARIIRRVTGPNTAIEEAELSGPASGMDLLLEAANQNFESIVAQRGTRDQSTARTQAVLAAARDGNANKLISVLKNIR